MIDVSKPEFLSRLSRLLPLVRRKSAKTVAVVRLAGVIGVGSALRPGLSLSAVNATLERAFAKKNIAAVAISVNSPGGSPVQSALIHDRIRQLAAEKNVPVLVFCEDVAASGGYWLALAGDEIHANDNSIIGSIGVIAMSFGFHEAIHKLGIERRVYTAGENKSFLDPFLKEDEADIARLKQIQEDVHETFRTHVRARRGARLDDSAEDLFTGAFWTGRRAKELGLIDGIGHLHEVLKTKFGDKVRIKQISKPSGFFARRFMPGAGFASMPPAAGLAEDALDALAVRAHWQRFGL